MPLRRAKRSDGRKRPRWKDGSHANVENTDAEHSRCDGLAFEPNPANELLEKVQSLLELNYELNVSTRDRPARTGADARIEGSEANGEVRLATRPYGRKNKRAFSHHLYWAFSQVGPKGLLGPFRGATAGVVCAERLTEGRAPGRSGLLTRTSKTRIRECPGAESSTARAGANATHGEHIRCRLAK